MTTTQEKIIQFFKDARLPVNGTMRPMSLQLKIREWDRRSQDEYPNAINDLVTKQYIGFNGESYVLLEKGYDYIFNGYTIEDTEGIIMDVFRNHKIGAGHFIMSNSFISTRDRAERFHFDNWNQALVNLNSKGLIEFRERGYVLTQAGYDYIY